ncbi:unnamed protein product [Cylicocyclus nassatus]|uniref:Uncharacterized protein n=1 Tax=Cylicocyclus nassatus TaxID=53992 RepID=A0AA36DLD4_CYLNA|nr:unnamed protein product [Cylicocyclus nassatus]
MEFRSLCDLTRVRLDEWNSNRGRVETQYYELIKQIVENNRAIVFEAAAVAEEFAEVFEGRALELVILDSILKRKLVEAITALVAFEERNLRVYGIENRRDFTPPATTPWHLVRPILNKLSRLNKILYSLRPEFLPRLIAHAEMVKTLIAEDHAPDILEQFRMFFQNVKLERDDDHVGEDFVSDILEQFCMFFHNLKLERDDLRNSMMGYFPE